MQSNTSHRSLRSFGWCVVLFLISTQSWSQDNLAITSPEQLEETATVLLKREKAFLFNMLKARVRLNGARIAKIGNGKTQKIIVPKGRNILAVSGFGAPGESTISFIAKAHESYEFVIAPRNSNFWAGVTGGAFGIGALFSSALEASLQSSEGGTFGIAISGSSELNQIQSTEKSAEDNSSNIEQELEKIEQLFKSSVISEDERNAMRKKILGID
jgi:hypothetical protein